MGIRGLPPNYGGFERHVDLLSRYLSNSCGQNILVACEKNWSDKKKFSDYFNVKLKYYPLIPGPRWLSETIFDINIMLSSLFIKDLDLIYYCGLSAGFFTFLPRLFGKKIIVNVDGFEWKNKKFNPILRSLLYLNILCLLKFPNALVTDNVSMYEYYKEHFSKDTVLIPYSVESQQESYDNIDIILRKYNLKFKKFFITVTRLEMMNSIEYIILEVEKIYRITNKISLVIVGNLSTDYGKYILDKYGSCEFVLFLGFISNPDELNILRKCAIAYIHGQVTGGTSPALLEALASGMIIASFDSISNRVTMKDTNYYFYYDYNYYLKNGKYKELLEDSLTPLSEKSLSSILEYIVNNYNQIYKKIESGNIALTKSEYGIEKISKLHLRLYNEICNISKLNLEGLNVR